MNNHEKNREIAKILGFEFIQPDHDKGIYYEQVNYPNDWMDEKNSYPCVDLPDFVLMLRQARNIAKIYKNGIPTDFQQRQVSFIKDEGVK